MSQSGSQSSPGGGKVRPLITSLALILLEPET